MIHYILKNIRPRFYLNIARNRKITHKITCGVKNIPTHGRSLQQARRSSRKNQNVASTSNEPKTIANRNIKRIECKFYPSSHDNKTNILCDTCIQHLCKKYMNYFCSNLCSIMVLYDFLLS